MELLKEFCEYYSLSQSKIDEFLKFKSNTNTNTNEIFIYTDGACSNNGKSNARAGIGIYFQDTKECISENIESVISTLIPEVNIKMVSNQKAELLAILKALDLSKERIRNKYIINIKTDSMYCINIFTKWYKTWEKKDWKASTGKEVLNKEIIQKILPYVKNYDINFSYVPAHKTEPNDKTKYNDWFGNMKADELAVKAIN